MQLIPKDRLIKNAWYLGFGRGTTCALWTGTEFVFVNQKFKEYVVKHCDHYDDGPPYGCFGPVLELAETIFPSLAQWEAIKKSGVKTFD